MATTVQSRDEYWMSVAWQMAKRAGEQGEVPVGAVLVGGQDGEARGELIAEAHNAPIQDSDPTAHAEINVLRTAGKRLDNYRFPNTTLYVTLEPCMMCAGAIVHSRVTRLVVGALETKAGAVMTHPLLNTTWLNHNIEITTGVLAGPCGELISKFFAARRGGENHRSQQGDPLA